MIRPLAFFWALRPFIAKTWADRKRHDPRGQEVDCPTTDYARATVAPNSDQEVDCPITDYTKEIEANPNDVTAYLALPGVGDNAGLIATVVRLGALPGEAIEFGEGLACHRREDLDVVFLTQKLD